VSRKTSDLATRLAEELPAAGIPMEQFKAIRSGGNKNGSEKSVPFVNCVRLMGTNANTSMNKKQWIAIVFSGAWLIGLFLFSFNLTDDHPGPRDEFNFLDFIAIFTLFAIVPLTVGWYLVDFSTRKVTPAPHRSDAKKIEQKGSGYFCS
jgi:hypothetical protein